MTPIRSWKFLAAILTLSFGAIGPVSAMTKISAADAIARANKAVGSNAWKIAFISNAGVTGGTVQARGVENLLDGFMDRNGLAEQWVIEYFKDSPKPYAEGGRKGVVYPKKTVVVTASEVSVDDSDIAVAAKVSPLNPRYIGAMESARQLALARAGQKFDAVSVSSDAKHDGTCFWMFRFYTKKNGGSLVATVAVTGDGTNVVGVK